MRVSALIVKVEGTIADISVDYSEALNLISKEFKISTWHPHYSSPFKILEELKNKLIQESYSKLLSEVSEKIDEAEKLGVENSRIVQGLREGLEGAKAMGVKIVALTKLGKVAAELLIRKYDLGEIIDNIIHRTKVDPPESLKELLKEALRQLPKINGEPLFLCSTAEEICEARVFGIKSVAIPTRKEAIQTILQARPDLMIINFLELPDLLVYESSARQS